MKKYEQLVYAHLNPGHEIGPKGRSTILCSFHISPLHFNVGWDANLTYNLQFTLAHLDRMNASSRFGPYRYVTRFAMSHTLMVRIHISNVN